MLRACSISRLEVFPLKILVLSGLAWSLLLVGCGGGGSDTPAPAPTPSTGATCVTGAPVAFNNPTAVTLAGAPATGIDVNVGSPQACPAVDAEVLGTANVGASSITAQDTGSQVHRGDTKLVILFGAGLNRITNISVSGQPNDFIISNVVNRNATDGTPGIQFQITIAPTAALGARSVVLRADNGDATVFTGGLEVLP
jgi:hypothetical protein